jgi:hypothetical protein
MNWLIPSYYYNIQYINTKCPYCGINVQLNRNIQSTDGQLKLIDLDHSPHNCSEQIRSVKGNFCKKNIDNKGGSN